MDQLAELNRVHDWNMRCLERRELHIRDLARDEVMEYAAAHPEFRRVLTANERREQYADEYARAVTRLDCVV